MWEEQLVDTPIHHIKQAMNIIAWMDRYWKEVLEVVTWKHDIKGSVSLRYLCILICRHCKIIEPFLYLYKWRGCEYKILFYRKINFIKMMYTVGKKYWILVIPFLNSLTNWILDQIVQFSNGVWKLDLKSGF